MNIYQTVPRIDCVRFAKCNKKSLAHCRKYRNTDSECKTCQLIRKRISNKYQTENEVYTKKLCSQCGRYLPLHRFYPRTIKRKDKTYHTYTSACKLCMNKPKQIIYE
nr:MAG TPA: Stc1 domain [Caudoviricetes sp.]